MDGVKLINMVRALLASKGRIRITADESYRCSYFRSDKSYGSCCPNKKLIEVDDRLSDRQTVKTFLHEVVHAINVEYPGPPITENQTLKLEEGLYNVLRLNYENTTKKKTRARKKRKHHRKKDGKKARRSG